MPGRAHFHSFSAIKDRSLWMSPRPSCPDQCCWAMEKRSYARANAPDGHCRRGRYQWLSGTAVEGRIADACRRVEASDHSLSFAAGHQSVKHDKAPLVPGHHHLLAWRPAAQLPDDRATDCRHYDRHPTRYHESHKTHLPFGRGFHYLAGTTEPASPTIDEVSGLFMERPLFIVGLLSPRPRASRRSCKPRLQGRKPAIHGE